MKYSIKRDSEIKEIMYMMEMAWLDMPDKSLCEFLDVYTVTIGKAYRLNDKQIKRNLKSLLKAQRKLKKVI